ncbi:hypothetical protein B0A68_01485 [Flavobacterium reichenbachii]|uniref:Uncharacterized protein n=1 Tax=Flavobacterium reichenbachii TaxID=362418 RepID=A0A085ZQG5_9FLAO|nr:hypothetical protein IW19_14720 [Flavobacterium reichenbachii]OXB18715.1 hypothetical protein B0A68_01485 [Flavobacterium reichenbachii]
MQILLDGVRTKISFKYRLFQDLEENHKNFRTIKKPAKYTLCRLSFFYSDLGGTEFEPFIGGFEDFK